jgi:hypothetical protein
MLLQFAILELRDRLGAETQVLPTSHIIVIRISYLACYEGVMIDIEGHCDQFPVRLSSDRPYWAAGGAIL